MTENTHGGPGRGQGRKLLDGKGATKVAVTLLPEQVEAMKRLGSGNLSAGIRKAIDMSIYINIDERYGDPVPVTLDDYKTLNPDGQFEQTENQIIETSPSPLSGPIVIALSQKLYDDSKRV